MMIRVRIINIIILVTFLFGGRGFSQTLPSISTTVLAPPGGQDIDKADAINRFLDNVRKARAARNPHRKAALYKEIESAVRDIFQNDSLHVEPVLGTKDSFSITKRNRDNRFDVPMGILIPSGPDETTNDIPGYHVVTHIWSSDLQNKKVLFKALKDRNVRIIALRAIIKIGQPAVDQVIDLIKDPELRNMAAYALYKINPRIYSSEIERMEGENILMKLGEELASGDRTEVAGVWPPSLSSEVVSLYVAGLFTQFDLDNYKPKGRVNATVQKELIQNVLPEISALRDSYARKRALRLLAERLKVIDYRPPLRIAIAKTIQEMGGSDHISVRNPFFAKALVAHSREIRSQPVPKVLGKKRVETLRTLLELLGNSSASTPELYLDVRGELAAWALYFHGMLESVQMSEELEMRYIKYLENAERLLDVAQDMKETSRENFLKSMRLHPITQESWRRKVDFENSALKAPEDIIREKFPISIGVLDLPLDQILLNPNNVQEGIFLNYGKRLMAEDIKEKGVRYSFLGVGQSKIAFLIEIEDVNGTVYHLVRNIVYSEQSPLVGLSYIEEEMNRLMLREPRIFELMAGNDVHEIGMGDYKIFWDEEYVVDKSLFDPRLERSFAAKTDAEKAEGEESPAWINRMRSAVRNYVKTCFQIWEAENRQRLDFDVNIQNITLSDKLETRVIDAGINLDDPETLADYLSIIRKHIAMLMDACSKMHNVPGDTSYGNLYGKITNEDIHDGILDALGEKEGKKVLLRILMFDTAQADISDIETSIDGLSNDEDKELIRDKIEALKQGEIKKELLEDVFIKILVEKEGSIIPANIMEKVKKMDVMRLSDLVETVILTQHLDFAGFVMEDGLKGLIDYMENGINDYVPEEIIKGVSPDEVKDAESRITYSFRKGIHELTESPWLWTYFHRKFLQEAFGGRAGKDNRKLMDALDELIADIKKDPEFFKPNTKKDRVRLEQWIDELSLSHDLDLDQERYFRESVSYNFAMKELLKVEIPKRLNVRKEKVKEELKKRLAADEKEYNVLHEDAIEGDFNPDLFKGEIDELIGLVIMTNVNPAGAAEEIRKIFNIEELSSDKRFVVLRSLGYPREQPPHIIPEEAFQDFIRHHVERNLIDRASFVDFLKNLQLGELLPLVKYDYDSEYYNDLLREFLYKDYKKFADIYRQRIEWGPDNVAELSYFLMTEYKIGPREIAYLFDEFETLMQGDIINSVVGWTDEPGKCHDRWHRYRQENPVDFHGIVLPKTADVLVEYFKIRPERAGKILASFFKKINRGISRKKSFAGADELVDKKGNRVSDIYSLFGLLPVDLWQEAVKHMTVREMTTAFSALLGTYLAFENDHTELLETIELALAGDEQSLATFDVDDLGILDNLYVSTKDEILEAQEERKWVISFVSSLDRSKPNSVDAIMFAWLVLKDIPESDMAEIMATMPARSIRKALLRLAWQSPSMFLRKLDLLMDLQDREAKTRLRELISVSLDDIAEMVVEGRFKPGDLDKVIDKLQIDRSRLPAPVIDVLATPPVDTAA